jgi:pullulanase
MVYGEGWNMPTALENSVKTTMDNALSLPKLSFFNDAFRDITKGATSENEFYKRGYLTGDLSYCEGFKFVFMGSAINYIFNKKFLTANQSINYVECHDNGTLYDKIVACGYDEEKDILRILKLINAVVLFSFGVPFFHMGQEIGLSKNMHQNTYNKGDKYNKMRWNLVDERFEYVSFLASLIKYRKTHAFLREYDAEVIDKSIDIVNLKNNVLKITYFNGKFEGKDKHITLIINPTNEVFYYSTGKTIHLIAGDGGYFENSKLSRDINWEVLYYTNNGRLEWLEYNIKRALMLETDSEEEQQLGINEVKETIAHVVYYESIKSELLKMCK